MEIDQAFSLYQIDPSAMIQLKQTGECTFTIPELYFDLFYPGQYRRRIRSARLTIPCVTGPYTNVSAVLSLVSSRIRKESSEPVQDVPPTRSVRIATSTAQNDAGVFQLDFRDERYMPFEGAGAVDSTWNLKLPTSFRTFDYETINDVILHISYTAEYDEEHRDTVEGATGSLVTALRSTDSLERAISLRQEFSNEFHQLLHRRLRSSVIVNLSEKHFPLFMQGRNLNLATRKIVAVTDQQAETDEGVPDEFIRDAVGLTVHVNGSAVGFSRHPDIGLPSGDFSPPAGVNAASVNPKESIQLEISIENAGSLGPDTVDESDATLDPGKLQDLVVYLKYGLG